MQCVDCGATNPEQKRFCGDCGSPLNGELSIVKRYLDDNLRREVRASLKEEVKDQKLVELETVEAIVEKLSSWAKLFAFFVGAPVVLVFGMLGFFGIQKYSDFSALIKDETASVSNTLSDARNKASSLRQQADQIDKDYNTLRSRLAETAALTGKVEELSKKVDRIGEEIGLAPSAKNTPELQQTLARLRGFQSYLGQVGFHLQNEHPMLVETTDSIPGNSIARFDEANNTLTLKSDQVGSLTLALSTYADHVIRVQKNFASAGYEYKQGISFYAAKFGLTAYLTCSFLDSSEFTYRQVDLSGSKTGLKDIRWAEEGANVWGALFWDIRTLLGQKQTDNLVVSAWLSVQPPINPDDFPSLFARHLLDRSKTTVDSKNYEKIVLLLKARGFAL